VNYFYFQLNLRW